SHAPDGWRRGRRGVRTRLAHCRDRQRPAGAGHRRVPKPGLARGGTTARGCLHPSTGGQGGEQMNAFSLQRLRSLLRKEWIQVRRDPMTLRLIIALPVMQLLLFGYAFNANPKHLPTGLLVAEHSKYERTIVAALQNTGYYDIRTLPSEAAAEQALADGELLFVINTPPQFDRAVDRGEQPAVLIDADATDPTAIGNATAALGALTTSLNRDLPPIRQVQVAAQPFQFVVH